MNGAQRNREVTPQVNAATSGSRKGHIMALAFAISVFVGFVAALALAVCAASLRFALARGREAYAELQAINRASSPKPVRLRRPQEAFAMAAV